MAEETLEVTKKEPRTEDVVEVENHVAVTAGRGIPEALEGEKIHVASHVWFVLEAGVEATQETFTRANFEDALDKVSRPLKGRFAHLPYSSEQFIQEKRQEIELEDR